MDTNLGYKIDYIKQKYQTIHGVPVEDQVHLRPVSRAIGLDEPGGLLCYHAFDTESMLDLPDMVET